MKNRFLFGSVLAFSLAFWACGDDTSSTSCISESSDSNSQEISSSSEATAESSNESEIHSSSSIAEESPSSSSIVAEVSSSSEESSSSSDESISSSSEDTSNKLGVWSFFEDNCDACKISASSVYYEEYDFTGLKGAVKCQMGESTYAGATIRIYEEQQDITDWGGLCAVFKSEGRFFLGIVPEDAKNYSGGINYMAWMESADSLVIADLPWEVFSRQDGFAEQRVTKEDFLTRIVGFMVQFEDNGPELDGSYKGGFEIQKIGPLGTCGTPTEGYTTW